MKNSLNLKQLFHGSGFKGLTPVWKAFEYNSKNEQVNRSAL